MENNKFAEGIRTVVVDGEIWFIARDAALALGFKSPYYAINHYVDEKDVRFYRVETSGGKQPFKIINKSALESLVHNSNALNGAYEGPRKPSYIIDDSIERALMWIEEEKERRRLAARVAELTGNVSDEESDMHSNCMVTTTFIANEYGMSPQKFNKLLCDLNVQYKRKAENRWHLYSDYDRHGYMQFNARNRATYWTPDGRKFLYKLLKDKGILPLSEKQKENREQLRFDSR